MTTLKDAAAKGMRIPAVIRRTTGAFPVRRIGNDYCQMDADLSVPGQAIVSQMLGGISMFFPPGERFMIASGQSIRDRILDDKLREDIDMFVRQEAQHASEHTRANKQLAASAGLDHVAVCREIVALWNFVEKNGSPRVRAGVTAATEHFTAIISEVLINDKKFIDSATNMAATQLFVWHAIEEAEHKAVMFDAYKEAGGPEWQRIALMALYTPPVFVTGILPVLRLVVAHRLLFDVKAWWTAAPLLLRWVPQMLWKYAQYYRPGFHPNHLYTRDLELYWRDRLGIVFDAHEAA
jgi:uncharacterized protein